MDQGFDHSSPPDDELETAADFSPAGDIHGAEVDERLADYPDNDRTNAMTSNDRTELLILLRDAREMLTKFASAAHDRRREDLAEFALAEEERIAAKSRALAAEAPESWATPSAAFVLAITAACPCGFVSSHDPNSSAFARGHRLHHLTVYPNSTTETRNALDQLVESYERREQGKALAS